MRVQIDIGIAQHVNQTRADGFGKAFAAYKMGAGRYCFFFAFRRHK